MHAAPAAAHDASAPAAAWMLSSSMRRGGCVPSFNISNTLGLHTMG